MSSTGLILLATTATVLAGGAATLTLGFNASRAAEVAQGLGVPGDDARIGPVARLLALVGRLRVNRPVRRRLASAGLSWDVATTELALAAAVVLVYLGTRPLIGRIAGGILAAAVPFVFFRWLRRRAIRRAERFIAQLPEVSRVLANGTSAGMSMERALALAAKEMPAPAKEELGRVVSQLTLGWALDDALTDLSERMPSRELNVLVRTIVIQAKAGGALVSALQDIAIALEDRKQLHREVYTAILASAFSGYIVPVLGLTSVVLLNLMKPGVLDDMVASFIGRLILLAALICFGLGMLLMRLVSRVEV